MNDEKSNTWFVGKDVALALGYVNPTKAVRVHVEEVDKLGSILDTSFGMKETIFISESGLYALVLSSKLSQACEFKHWVTSEVLPQIRQTEREPFWQRSVTTVHIIANSIYFVKIGCPFVVGVHPYLHAEETCAILTKSL